MSLEQLSQAFATMVGPHDAATVSVSDQQATELTDVEVTHRTSDRSKASDSSAAVAEDEAVSPRGILEAVLFVGRPDNLPLTSQQIAGLMRGVKAEEIDSLIVELNGQYAADGCPYRIDSEGEGYRLVLRTEYGPLRERFYGRIRAARLSPAAVEVLSLVAYKEPLTADEVSRLRGVPSGHILRHLVQRQLLRLERGPSKPRKSQYFTTRRFLEVFGLKSLGDLPRSDDEIAKR